MKKEMLCRGELDYAAHAEEIARAVASIMKEKRGPFARVDVRGKLGILPEEWLWEYAAIFQGMRVDHSGGVPDVGARAQVTLVLIVYLGGLYSLGSNMLGVRALVIANSKVNLGFVDLVARGVVCNWLVCLAVWTATSAEDTTGKIFACFFPIMAFVASGFEHSVANMFFVPMGIMLKGVPSLIALSNLSIANLTWSGFIINNLVPVTLGNIIGGCFFVSTLYWYVYLRPAARALDLIEELNPVLRLRRRELYEE